MSDLNYDFIIIGSGFGGSVSALRLCEKGYKVLLIEKGNGVDGRYTFRTSPAPLLRGPHSEPQYVKKIQLSLNVAG